MGAAVVAELKALTRSVNGVERRLGGVERKLDEIRDQLCAQARMTRELLGRVRGPPDRSLTACSRRVPVHPYTLAASSSRARLHRCTMSKQSGCADTGARATAWCLLIHAEASVFLSRGPGRKPGASLYTRKRHLFLSIGGADS